MEKSQKSNINLSLNSEYRQLKSGGYQHINGGPIINGPETQEFLDGLTEASKTFDPGLMSLDELAKI